jgi:hypothetical protein
MDTVPRSDPVIEFYMQFVDRESLRANLKLTVDERLDRLERVAAETLPSRPQQPAPARPWQPVSDCGLQRLTDPIIELFKRDVDRTLLRENLKLTPDERLLKLTDFTRFAEDVRAAGMRARESG